MVFNIQRQENIQRESLSFLYTHTHTPLPTIIIITMLASRSGVSSLGMETPESHPRQLVVSLLHPLHTFRAFALAVPLQAHTSLPVPPHPCVAHFPTAFGFHLKYHLLKEAWPGHLHGALSTHQLYFSLQNFSLLGIMLCISLFSNIHLPASTRP